MAGAEARAKAIGDAVAQVHSWPKGMHLSGCNCVKHGGACNCPSCESFRSRTVLWRCTACGKWSHAQRCSRSHVRYLPEYDPQLNQLDDDAVEWVENGTERDTGAKVFSGKIHCGPFERWVAERAKA